MVFQRPRRRAGGKGERGQALIEFGLVALVFFALVFGILDMARLFQSWNSVQHSAREAARFAITIQTNCSIDGQSFNTRDACIKATARNATAGLTGGGINATDANVHITTKAWGFPDYLDADAVDGARGYICDIIQVKVNYRYKFVTPILQGLVPGGVALIGSQRMTNEPACECISTTANDPIGP